MIRELLQTEINKALTALDLPTDTVNLEHPAELAHGDYATNIAMVLGKRAGKNPRELAEAIAGELSKNKHKYLDKIEVAGPGFINFQLSAKFFADALQEILSAGEEYGKSSHARGFKTVIEYTQPNPFKVFHIGHLMNNIIGESISRIFEANGADVKRATYHGDVGIHVAKTLYGLERLKPAELTVAVLGEAYALGNKEYETDEKAKQEIVALNKKIYERTDPEVTTLYDEGRRVSLEHFESLYRRLGSAFDFHFFESESGPVGKEIVLQNVAKGIFEQSEGAVVYKGEKHGLHTRVFLNSEGLPTYEAKELGLLELKKKAGDFDQALTITANEQDEFFKVVEKAIEDLNPGLPGRVKHVSHGMLKLPSGKMSSRTGTIISAESLIEDVRTNVLEKIADREFAGADREAIVEDIAQAAIRYSILKQAIGRDVIFDFEKSLSFEGDSGPYLQYAHTRTKSVLLKAAEAGIRPAITEALEINDVIRLLYRFPYAVLRAGADVAPHHIVTYLTELSSAFSSWYAKEKIVDANNPKSAERVAVTTAVGQVLQTGLRFLGIRVPDKM